jgi:hypothetical protein
MLLRGSIKLTIISRIGDSSPTATAARSRKHHIKYELVANVENATGRK